MLNVSSYRKIYLVLRIAVAMCFIGHGAFGIITKSVWCNYFAVFGIGTHLAYQLMPVVGVMDILLGIAILVYPNRFSAAWLVGWGLLTALLRPLSGEPFAEFIERAGNFGAPFALLILVGTPRTVRNYFSPMRLTQPPSAQAIGHVYTCLRITGFLLLAGHGWLNLLMKKGLLLQYAGVGIGNITLMATTVGVAEIVAACIVLIKPYRELIFVFFLWKMLSEAFYLDYALLEWIERGGSYGVLLSLWLLTSNSLFGSKSQKEASLTYSTG